MDAHHEASLRSLGVTDADIAVMNALGLPPGTIIGIIVRLLPILLQILQGLGGVTTGGTAPTPPAAP